MPYPLPPTLSPSRVAAFCDCALAYRFANLDRLPEPPSPHAAKGTLVHAALEALFALPAADRTPTAARACLDGAAAALVHDPDFALLGLDADATAAFVADAHRLLDGYFAMEDPRQVHAVGLELKLRAEIGGVQVTGIIDRLDRLADGTFVVVDYKGLALDTPLPTPTGWTTMAEVQVGDEVVGANGQPTRVLVKSGVHHRPCYRITFSDGSHVVCDNEHLWNVSEVGSNWRGDRADKTVDADALYELFQSCRTDGRPRGLVIRTTAALDLAEQQLPIDPWLVGVWLGDGASRSGGITVGHEDLAWMLERLAETPFTIRIHESAERATEVQLIRPHPDRCHFGHAYDGATRRRGNRRYAICSVCRRDQARRSSTGQRRNISLTTALRQMGMLGKQHVPTEYLRGSTDQRLALLQGLMDTDGHWHTERCRAVFVTTNDLIASVVRELVHSLGVTSYEWVDQRGGSTVHRIEFRPVGFNPFRMPRKARGVEAMASEAAGRRFLGNATRRSITDMEPVPSVPTQCIGVDSPDSLYLCGRSMVPTHNTGRAPSEKYEQGKLLGVDTYSVLCERVLGVRPSAVRLLYVADGIAITCRPSDRSTRFIEQKVGAVWQTIQRANATDSFRPRTGRLCDWCAFKTWCPAWGGDPDGARRYGEELRAQQRDPDAVPLPFPVGAGGR